jgi:NAD(P)-dependent dehydrogenase (short-subunit alcohol dehydrogenase family)
MVTGGAHGIGRATVEKLAAEGAEVILADMDKGASLAVIEELDLLDGTIHFQPVDLASPASIKTMAEELLSRYHRLHGLVNNCGISLRCAIADTGDEDWDPQMTINLRAPALLARHLLPLLKRGPASIVNISSEGAFRPRSHRWVYDASKAAICSLTRTMAIEFAEFGMRVNTVAPGWTVTEMHYAGAADPQAKKGELENLEYGGALIRRLARPEEIASAIVFLLSENASYVTATTIHVDGGRITP